MTLRRLTTALAALALTLTATTTAHAADNPPPLTDLDGNPLIPHGFNNGHSSKDSPDAMPWTTPADIAAEADKIGSNSVRLLIYWSKVEPEPGRYDEAYLDQVTELVGAYDRADMHVVLDMHQDIWGPAVTGTGRNGGAPAWASHFDGLPASLQDPWPLTYLQPGVMRAFDHFWGTTGKHPELAEHFTAAWAHVAQRFADDDRVLGYDLFNEPWGGSVPWPFFEKDLLGPLYQRTIDAIREVDPDHWIFVEPQAFGVNQALIASSLPELTDPRPGRPRLAYAPHLYPLLLDSGQAYTGVTRAITQETMRKWFADNTATARRLGMPMVIGEFGLDATREGSLDYVDDVLAMAEQAGVGWWYWSNDPGGWGPYNPDGSWAPLADHLAAGTRCALSCAPR
ncbi:endoglycosylceramidase [Saccharopolyspora kobensis]|uniref:Endoglycosylceramidase n=1 Tax=Saccharopolyspora kobensis TaxID=146035 RepID=A0A1H5WF57_9PSEU|nr:glycoside hydrolase family 5 protein [Saccharopolyspora kobensis]SEF98000.1 endoglycosylceramidase [Saccharopolyspora kobensis]SFD75099.1 endoglycosylceramidase [Saccharopolyspora kobensis]